jgi:Putative quorum-sensing-regulated virulence factor
MKMPFGRYKGVELDEIPTQYLEWLARNVDLRGLLRGAVLDQFELHRRNLGRDQRANHTFSTDAVTIQVARKDLELTAQVFNFGFRRAARVFHPDAGGDASVMIALNALAEAIRSQFAAVGRSQ